MIIEFASGESLDWLDPYMMAQTLQLVFEKDVIVYEGKDVMDAELDDPNKMYIIFNNFFEWELRWAAWHEWVDRRMRPDIVTFLFGELTPEELDGEPWLIVCYTSEPYYMINGCAYLTPHFEETVVESIRKWMIIQAILEFHGEHEASIVKRFYFNDPSLAPEEKEEAAWLVKDIQGLLGDFDEGWKHKFSSIC